VGPPLDPGRVVWGRTADLKIRLTGVSRGPENPKGGVKQILPDGKSDKWRGVGRKKQNVDCLVGGRNKTTTTEMALAGGNS